MKIFTENIEPSTLSKLYDIEKSGIYDHIRVMPDVHEGSSIVGFTGYFKDKISPHVIGPDIGCGVLCVNLGKTKIDPVKLDKVIRRYIPDGKNIRDRKDKWYEDSKIDLSAMYCYDSLYRVNELERSIGTLGSGNHFCEVDVDCDGNYYILVHTGSRNLGKQVYNYYASKSDNGMLSEDSDDEYFFDYLQDCNFCNKWAKVNRWTIAENILSCLGLRKVRQYDYFDCPHNFIEGNLVRKGACKAVGRIIIPMNMRDGALICYGKSNEDWNHSAPHGAGRLMSRSQAKKQLLLEQYKEEMKDVYSTSVNEHTIDESPMAYKPMQEIIDNIQDTVEIVQIIKPIYNFKSSGEDK